MSKLDTRQLIKEASEVLIREGYQREARLLSRAAKQPDIELAHERYMLAKDTSLLKIPEIKDWFHRVQGKRIHEMVFKSPQEVTEEEFKEWYGKWAKAISRDTEDTGEASPRDMKDPSVEVEKTSEGTVIIVREIIEASVDDADETDSKVDL